MTQHPHAEVLRAIADGVPLSEFEVFKTDWSSGTWRNADGFYGWAFGDQDNWEIRRKPQHIMVNGFKVPKPIGLNCGHREVWTPGFMTSELASNWTADENISAALRVGVAHATKEAAIAHAKAMLGIDPEYFK